METRICLFIVKFSRMISWELFSNGTTVRNTHQDWLNIGSLIKGRVHGLASAITRPQYFKAPLEGFEKLVTIAC